jgi:hypothetical protein
LHGTLDGLAENLAAVVRQSAGVDRSTQPGHTVYSLEGSGLALVPTASNHIDGLD